MNRFRFDRLCVVVLNWNLSINNIFLRNESAVHFSGLRQYILVRRAGSSAINSGAGAGALGIQENLQPTTSKNQE